MNEKEYNGWTNYETWLTNLWLSNDEGIYARCRAISEDTFAAATSSPTLTRLERYRLDFADAMKELVIEGNPLVDSAGLYCDLLTGALREVNWREIAANMFEDVNDTPSES